MKYHNVLMLVFSRAMRLHSRLYTVRRLSHFRVMASLASEMLKRLLNSSTIQSRKRARLTRSRNCGLPWSQRKGLRLYDWMRNLIILRSLMCIVTSPTRCNLKGFKRF